SHTDEIRRRANEAEPRPGFVSLVPYREPLPSPDKERALSPVRQHALGCEKCRLCEKRTSVVWGEGSLDARVMFIGEGPGRDEDEQGRPFVGRSGRLLTDIIEKGMKVGREQVYIANVVKCRPPGNRDPMPDEIAACSTYLHDQIAIIDPQVIVAVGGVAGCALLGLPPRSPGLRGRWHELQGRPLRVIYHPSYLLRQRRTPDDRTKADRDTWNDILEVMKRLDIS
ncbi:MAG: uracil-DNA glycosylase, partial [Planctomycetes bacterium]|nr:uracil-DNA glycosylase [Planctomycetota bacterium]